MAKTKYFSRGKLLITGEYAVVNGAKALAIPSKLGQTLTVSTGRGSDIVWKSLDKDGKEWFTAKISLFDLAPVKTSDETIAERLCEILKNAVRLNSDFLSTWKGIKVETKVDFPIEWGLGTSSTLVNNIAQWADVNPYELYERSFGGSGYDIACASADQPILFQRISEDEASVKRVKLPSEVMDHLCLVYSGRKQNSAEALAFIEEHPMEQKLIDQISAISESIIEATKPEQWVKLLKQHNQLLESYLHQEAEAKADWSKSCFTKPLGAWGGDFYMAISPELNGKLMKDLEKSVGAENCLKAADLLAL